MKKILGIGALLVIVLIAVLYLTADKAHVVPPVVEEETEVDVTVEEHADFGFSYTYPSGSDGYTKVEQDSKNLRGDLVFAESLFNSKEYAEFSKAEYARESPVSLSIEVYRNPFNQTAQEWSTTAYFQAFAIGQSEEVKLGDTSFLKFRTDGLYAADVYVATSQGYVYVFTNSWTDEQSLMKKDMEEVLASLSWSVPLVLPQVAHSDIKVTSPLPSSRISSPLTIEGQARGYWFFEASFPVTLVDWDGLIIAEGIATAQGEWMTEEFVPFTAELTFIKPSYGERGALILKKDNPSGLPENDDAIEIPVFFQ